MTLLRGQITGTTLSDIAGNARCVTEISLDRLAPVPPRPHPKRERRAATRMSDLVLRPEQLDGTKHP